jgi:hypothetical protein
MNSIALLFVVLVLLVSIRSTDANKARRRHERQRRRYTRKIKACNDLQANHTAAILAKEDVDIFSRDYVCFDNLEPFYPDMCSLLYDVFSKGVENSRFIDNFKRYYLVNIYTISNFPFTYRPNREIADLNITTIRNFYVKTCFKDPYKEVVYFWAVMMPFIIFALSFCGSPAK